MLLTYARKFRQPITPLCDDLLATLEKHGIDTELIESIHLDITGLTIARRKIALRQPERPDFLKQLLSLDPEPDVEHYDRDGRRL